MKTKQLNQSARVGAVELTEAGLLSLSLLIRLLAAVSAGLGTRIGDTELPVID